MSTATQDHAAQHEQRDENRRYSRSEAAPLHDSQPRSAR
jgi:hypothetical protein